MTKKNLVIMQLTFDRGIFPLKYNIERDDNKTQRGNQILRIV